MSDYCPDCGCKHGCLCGYETPPIKAESSFAAPTGLGHVKEPVVSVDRASQTIAAFDGFDIIHPFTPYDDEESAIMSMKVWLAMRMPEGSPNWPPQVVYPLITKMRVS